jgi:hypothetical protein
MHSLAEKDLLDGPRSVRPGSATEREIPFQRPASIPGARFDTGGVFSLQRSIGNRATARVVQRDPAGESEDESSGGQAAQAAALQAAGSRGAPFCEECERANQAGRAH